jgi:hypothetical protein
MVVTGSVGDPDDFDADPDLNLSAGGEDRIRIQIPLFPLGENGSGSDHVLYGIFVKNRFVNLLTGLSY